MPRLRRLLTPLLAFAALGMGLTTAPPALASHTQLTFFEAPRNLINVRPEARTKSIAQLQALGVKALRVELNWHEVAPAADSSQRPAFDATDPASYDWSAYDPLLAEAQRLGWKVLLTVTAPVPMWATAGHNDKNLVTRPDDRQFQEFMTAVGRHYGSEVWLFAIWNEPNHPAFLRPQFNPNGTPASPRIYRGLFQAGYEGLKLAGIAKPKVLMGETAPFGFDRVKPKREGVLHDVAPLEFLRETLCLNAKYRKAGTCGSLPAYGFAHHGYTTGQGPSYKPPEPDDVTIGVLSRLSNALNKAAAAHALPRRIPIYLTEFGIQSKPNVLGVSLAKQAEYDAMSEKIAWSNSRVAAFSQYLLRDDPLGGSAGSSVHGGFVGFQTGLETVKGARKPIYAGFPVPLVVVRQVHGYSLWGYVRPAMGSTKVQVLVQRKGSSGYRPLKQVRTSSSGYWTLRSSVVGSHWRVSWRSPSGTVYTGPPIAAS
jgi:hypothetical protein